MATRLPAPLRALMGAYPGRIMISNGSRHRHIRVDGALVGILPHARHARSIDNGRAMANALAQIRRALAAPADGVAARRG